MHTNNSKKNQFTNDFNIILDIKCVEFFKSILTFTVFVFAYYIHKMHHSIPTLYKNNNTIIIYTLVL